MALTDSIIIGGTLVSEGTNVYWFPDRIRLDGRKISPAGAIAILETELGRSLSTFETSLCLAQFPKGWQQVTLIAQLSSNEQATSYLKKIQRIIIGYVIKRHSFSAHYGDINHTEGFYQIDGKLVGQLRTRRRQEPGLERPFIDPIDLLAGAIASIVKGGAKAAAAAAFEKTLARDAAGTVELEGTRVLNQLKAAGHPPKINLGGTGEEAFAVNLNPNVVAPRTNIPYHVARFGEQIGELFEANSVQQIISNRLPPNTLDWSRVITGAQKVLQPGGKIIIRFQGVGEDAATIMSLFQKLGFKNIKNYGGAALEAVK